MERILSWLVDNREEGQTAAEYLKQKGCSRQVLRQLGQQEDGILRNGAGVYMRDRLWAGDCIRIHLREESASGQIEPVRLPFQIVYEDEDLLVVHKPADMPVHPSVNNYGNTLANAMAWYQREKGESYPYRCVNRLDRNTTGLLILAKHMLSAAVLYGQMKERRIQRTYLALVNGELKEPGTIDAPIGRKEGSAVERAVDFARGERAVTHYRPISRGTGWTLAECRLETGRTHQIRVHMAWIGHPLPGDFLYCPGDRSMERQPLHSWRLQFPHPITGEELVFTCPLPADMLEYMKKGDRR